MNVSQKLSRSGMAYPMVVELIRQIDGTAPDAAKLVTLGVPHPVAVELAAQIDAGAEPPVKPVERLVASGVVPQAAKIIVDYIAEVNA